ncbi:MAG: hypothetical protein QNJ34_18900 [Xenococcaceae cyanobacterium MO_188.B29]|nr:hypothetical protein [Xenococcaceae cyanobacterium MO_188.B29]
MEERTKQQVKTLENYLAYTTWQNSAIDNERIRLLEILYEAQTTIIGCPRIKIAKSCAYPD